MKQRVEMEFIIWNVRKNIILSIATLSAVKVNWHDFRENSKCMYTIGLLVNGSGAKTSYIYVYISIFVCACSQFSSSHLLILGYCSMASLLPDWRRTDTCIHHLSVHMVNTKLHIYHLVCNLLSWYIINKHKHDSMKNSSFALLTRTRLTATFDLAMPTSPSHTLIQNSPCILPSFWLFFRF